MMKISLLALALTTASAARRRLAEQLDLPKLAEDADEGLLGSRVLFQLESSVDASSIAAKVSSILDCGSSPERIFRSAGKFEAAHKQAGLDRWYQVECGGSSDDKTAASKEMFAHLMQYLDSDDHDGVFFIEPEMDESLLWTPDDPKLNTQDHYDAIRLFEAWDVTKGSADVVVQVLDTGIDMSHPDLKMNIWRNEGEICGNGVDDDNNGYVDDCHGYNHADDTGTDLVSSNWHGSHCGGTIAADSNNGVGVAGVAGGDGSENSGVKLMISVGFGDTAVKGFGEALTYGADMGAQISSNSWGYTGPGYIAQSIKDAIDYYNAKNGIVVFAAGNQNSASDYYPAYYDGTIAVAAVTDAGVRASFSNYGDWIEISAPGVSVYSTQLGTAYGYASGTSMACPHVAGVLALGLSVAPDATKDELLACMYETAKDVDGSNGAYAGKLGAGLVDAEAFLACVGEGADPRPTPRPTPPPSVEPEEPPPKPENLKVKMHRKAGDQALASWSHAATASRDMWAAAGLPTSASVAVNGYLWQDIFTIAQCASLEGDVGDDFVMSFTAESSCAEDLKVGFSGDGSGGWLIASIAPGKAEYTVAGPRIWNKDTRYEIRSDNCRGAKLALSDITFRAAGDDGRKFVVEYQTNHDETWTRVDKGRSYVSEVDGRFYQPIHAPCLTKGRVRVTAVDHGDSAPAYSDIFKMKCRE